MRQPRPPAWGREQAERFPSPNGARSPNAMCIANERRKTSSLAARGFGTPGDFWLARPRSGFGRSAVFPRPMAWAASGRRSGLGWAQLNCWGLDALGWRLYRGLNRVGARKFPAIHRAAILR